MDRKKQEHQQELQKMRQQLGIDVQQLNHEAKLKKELKEVCLPVCLSLSLSLCR